MTDQATPAEEVAALRPQPKGFGVIKAAFRERRTLAMLLLGFSAGLPFAMLFGTLNAWLSEVDVSVATIGILSWVGLFGAFKFLWSPAVGLRLPLVARMGRRRSWLVVCQSVLALVFIVIAASVVMIIVESRAGNALHLADALFETISAFGTVGLSKGITFSLHPASKIVLIITMFVGRVGLFALALPRTGRDVEGYAGLPSADIMI